MNPDMQNGWHCQDDLQTRDYCAIAADQPIAGKNETTSHQADDGDEEPCAEEQWAMRKSLYSKHCHHNWQRENDNSQLHNRGGRFLALGHQLFASDSYAFRRTRSAH